MKNLYILLFAANLCLAQSSDLINTNWQVTKVVGELYPDQLPPPMPYQQVTQFSSNPSKLNLSFFNSVISNVIYSNNDTFAISDKVCTLASFLDDNGEVNQFFGKLCGFFDNGNNYHYTIQNNGSEKTLVISNSIFQEIHFKSAQLSVKDNESIKPSVFPNPATEYIVVENLKTNSNIELIDSSGKLVKMISNKSSREEIDIKNLIPGIYYLKADGKMIQKVIKK
ncbi:T9SS type A sorting domain-containing protein [Epilithonimonas zeae]|uniref:T9SS type A sorting domain-containing protein n=1 Tax=Epilithonimonas zeae TaxID=1416779 RepID=UPI00200E7FAC|nr:T9SS type A sorting domain-containing protein [Epilithonimonas zeae]UQB70346.1 T9SS type A sorting domain-containing protein [Epilithonimonas zeae]